MVGLLVTSKRASTTLCETQGCCSQSPCSRHRPLLTCASKGDTQTLKGRPGSVSAGPLGPGVHKALFEPSVSLAGTGSDSKHHFLLGLLLCP